MNQYEIDYQQGYDTANGEWLERISKIRSEIDSAKMPKTRMSSFYDGINTALDIIDKYKTESKVE
jgi:hypothetical protein